MIRYCFLLLILVSLTACQAITPAPYPTDTIPGESGIYGQVLVGPACPGPERLGATECADQPLQTSITVVDLDGKFVTRFESDEDGHFKVPLEPGDYILQPGTGDIYPHANELQVSVPQDEYIEVIIQYDSGIR